MLYPELILIRVSILFIKFPTYRYDMIEGQQKNVITVFDGVLSDLKYLKHKKMSFLNMSCNVEVSDENISAWL